MSLRIRLSRFAENSTSRANHAGGTLVVAALAIAAVAGFPAAATAQIMSYAPAAHNDAASQAFSSIDENESGALPERLKRTVVAFDTREAPGTVVIDTGNTYLYYVLGGGRALRYGVGVGRQGFTWAGIETVSRKAEWPDWIPPSEMIARQPYLPRWVAGGPGNPLGARAMYLGNSSYRIHGTNNPSTIGKFVSSGCIRMTNDDVIDLFSRVQVGAKVVVLPKRAPDLVTQSPALPAARRVSTVIAVPNQPAVQRQALNSMSGVY